MGIKLQLVCNLYNVLYNKLGNSRCGGILYV